MNGEELADLLVSKEPGKVLVLRTAPKQSSNGKKMGAPHSCLGWWEQKRPVEPQGLRTFMRTTQCEGRIPGTQNKGKEGLVRWC